MGDTIRAISELVDRHGLSIAVSVILLAMLCVLMTIHFLMLKKWVDSTERLAKSADERMTKSDQRVDSLLVSNLNMQKAMVEVNVSQDKKLETLVNATKTAADKVVEQKDLLIEIKDNSKASAEASIRLTELIGSDPHRLCRMAEMLKAEGFDEKTIKTVLRKWSEDHIEKKDQISK